MIKLYYSNVTIFSNQNVYRYRIAFLANMKEHPVSLSKIIITHYMHVVHVDESNLIRSCYNNNFYTTDLPKQSAFSYNLLIELIYGLV